MYINKSKTNYYHLFILFFYIDKNREDSPFGISHSGKSKFFLIITFILLHIYSNQMYSLTSMHPKTIYFILSNLN